MARRDQVVKRLELQAIKDAVDAPVLIRVRTRILVHGRSSTGEPCPCCGSRFAAIVKDVDDLDLLIDTEEGTRDLRHDFADAAEYDEIADQADLVLDVPLRCSELGLRILLSPARTTIGQGASRSSKTQHGMVWAFRQWMLRGGSNAEAIFAGAELRHAHVLLQKWVHGEKGSPPVCPKVLVVSHPTRLREEDQTIRMLDGTKIHLLHMKTDGTNLAGISPVFINATELGHVHDPQNWGQLRTRVISTGGPIYIDAVPEAGSWIRHGILQPARREAEERAAAAVRGEELGPPEWQLLELAAEDNPWNAPGEGTKAVEVLEATDPRMAARIAGGEDVGDANKSFADLIRDDHRFEYEGWDVSRLGLVDITRAATASYFPRVAQWLLGVDVNAHPHSALVGKIAVRHEHVLDLEPTRYASIPRDRWVFVFFDYIQCWGLDSLQAAQHLAKVEGGRFAGACVVMDASSANARHNAGGALNANRGIVPRRAFEDAGFCVRPPGRSTEGKPQNPRREDSALVCRRLLATGAPGSDTAGRGPAVLINAYRCMRFLEALRDQEAEPTGFAPKETSNTWADRHIKAATDCFRYVAWPLARIDLPTTDALDIKGFT